jgi:hypothetical protein
VGGLAGGGADPEPTALRETVFWSPSLLESPNAADEINSSAVYGLVAVGHLIAAVSGRLRIAALIIPAPCLCL